MDEKPPLPLGVLHAKRERVGVRGSAESAACHNEATAGLAAAPHPNPLPLKKGERE